MDRLSKTVKHHSSSSHVRGKWARNTADPHWAKDMCRVFVYNFQVKIDAIAKAESALAAAESDLEAAKSAPAAAEPDRANFASAVY